MKELFTAFSRYNRETNRIIFEKIRTLDSAQIGYPIKAHYKSIGDTVSHVMASDLRWLDRLSRFHESGVEKDELDAFKSGNLTSPEKISGNMEAFRELRSRIDSAIIELMESIPENAFPTEIEIFWGTGSIRTELWKLLLQWFNHHTHHRGQVSIQLDALGIDNDYSLMLDKIE